MNTERYLTPDNRRVETTKIETDTENIIETRMDEAASPPITQRVIERKKPVVVERETQTIKNGNVVDSKVEAVQPGYLVESNPVTSVPSSPAGVTREEVASLIANLVAKAQKENNAEVTPEYVRSQGLADMMSQLKESSNSGLVTIGLFGVIGLLLGYMIWAVYFMG